MNKIASKYLKATDALGRFCGIVGVIMMVLLVLLTVADVFLRFFFNSPILGSFELTEYLLVVIVFFAIPWATQEDINVRVDLFTGKLRGRNQAKVYAVSCVLSIVITFILGWYTVPQAKYIYDLNVESDMLKIPSYPFYFLVAIGFFFLFFILIARFIRYIEEAVSE